MRRYKHSIYSSIYPRRPVSNTYNNSLSEEDQICINLSNILKNYINKKYENLTKEELDDFRKKYWELRKQAKDNNKCIKSYDLINTLLSNNTSELFLHVIPTVGVRATVGYAGINDNPNTCGHNRYYLRNLEEAIYSGEINRDDLDKNVYLSSVYTHMLGEIKNNSNCSEFLEENSTNYFTSNGRDKWKRDANGKVLTQSYISASVGYISSLLNFSDTSTNTSVPSITSATGTDVNGIAETLAPITRVKLPSLPDFSWVIDNLGIILIIIIFIYGVFLIIRLWTSRKIPNLILMFIIFIIVCLLYMVLGSMFTQLMFILGDFFARLFFPNIILNKNQDMLFWDNIWYILLITYILLLIATIVRSVKEKEIHASTIIWGLAILFILFIYTIIYYFVFAYDNIENIFYSLSFALFWITIIFLILRYFKMSFVQYIYIFYAIFCYLYIVCFFIYLYKVLNDLYDKYL